MNIRYNGEAYHVDDALVGLFGGEFIDPTELRKLRPATGPIPDNKEFEVDIPSDSDLESAIALINEHESHLASAG